MSQEVVMIIEDSILINESKEKIWPYMTDPQKILQWCITFRKFEYTGEQHQGIGTTFYVEEKAAGPLPVSKLDFESTAWKENELISFTKTSPGGPTKYIQEWKITPENSGSRFTFKEEIDMPFGFIGKIIESVAKEVSASSVEKMLLQLKNSVESEQQRA
jgi:uncharacterized protein YndB with AHSA1/START domain